MNKSTLDNIIVALATPYGRSAIAAIRMSGGGSIELAQSFLSRPLKAECLKKNRFIAGSFAETLTAVCFKAPYSYTGEDTVELYPHGNMVVCNRIISELIGAGARAAERGEFTKRAFLNGKLDLMQCEALADIIDAQTSEQLEYGNKRFDGGFKSLGEAEKLLKTALSSVEAVLHYSDELEAGEIEASIDGDVYAALDRVIAMLESELKGYDGGRVINDGFKVALIGAPNAGKSTLLNALTESDRAIVTPIAGTTRDTVDGEFAYNGRKFIVTDTAGLTETLDKVERLGVERAKKAAEHADAVVFFADGEIKPPKTTCPIITVQNKCDAQADVGTDYKAAENGGALMISAKCGINIKALKQKLYDASPKSCGGICNHRQYDCVSRCLEACKSAKKEGKKADGLEIVAAALYEAYSAICALYGEGDADERVLDAVFDRFCVGK